MQPTNPGRRKAPGHLIEPLRTIRFQPVRLLATVEQLAGVCVSAPAARLGLALIVTLAVLAPLGPLAANRFHADEATYSSWGVDIASGRDVLVSGSPVDKPPLFLYVQALSFLVLGVSETAARLPSLIAGILSVLVVYRLGRQLHGPAVGLLGAALWAASPYYILFTPTAFTDSLMVAFVVAGCWAAAAGHRGRAGLLLGLAAITKQQGILFTPLVVGLSGLAARRPIDERSLPDAHVPQPRLPRRAVAGWTSFAVGLVAMLCLALAWDVARGRQPGFLMQSLDSYGDLDLGPILVWKRLLGFLSLLPYATGSPLLNGILLVGLPLLLAADILACLRGHSLRLCATGTDSRSPERAGSCAGLRRGACGDLLMSGFVGGFLIGHAVLPFQVWDRYLLGIVPLLALLSARVLTLPWRLYQTLLPPVVCRPASIRSEPIPAFLHLAFVLALLTALVGPVQDAVTSRFPIGGDHGAYQGIEQVVNFFKTVPADTTLYHRWLGGQWRFYLWGSPYDFRAWSSPADLAAQASARRGANRYVVFPSWASSTETRLALAHVGLTLREVQRAFRDDGSVSFVVFRIEETR
jgi:hypothetical protein